MTDDFKSMINKRNSRPGLLWVNGRWIIFCGRLITPIMRSPKIQIDPFFAF